MCLSFLCKQLERWGVGDRVGQPLDMLDLLLVQTLCLFRKKPLLFLSLLQQAFMQQHQHTASCTGTQQFSCCRRNTSNRVQATGCTLRQLARLLCCICGLDAENPFRLEMRVDTSSHSSKETREGSFLPKHELILGPTKVLC